jgi:hypothetical protein
MAHKSTNVFVRGSLCGFIWRTAVAVIVAAPALGGPARCYQSISIHNSPDFPSSVEIDATAVAVIVAALWPGALEAARPSLRLCSAIACPECSPRPPPPRPLV